MAVLFKNNIKHAHADSFISLLNFLFYFQNSKLVIILGFIHQYEVKEVLNWSFIHWFINDKFKTEQIIQQRTISIFVNSRVITKEWVDLSKVSDIQFFYFIIIISFFGGGDEVVEVYPLTSTKLHLAEHSILQSTKLTLTFFSCKLTSFLLIFNE